MENYTPLVPGTRVRTRRFGVGTVELDKGLTVIVRFEHGIEACERAVLEQIRSVDEAIDSERWDRASGVINRVLASAIVSVNDRWGVFSRSRIALLPHQLWVCRKVLATWPARWLIADDVGLGKTIEAGLILWPLLSKGLVRRFLIVCPASLVEQWQYRLRTMFDIRVTRYVSAVDTERTDFWATHHYVAASLETLRLDRAGRHQRLFDGPPWDLLIVDEAHHANADEASGPTLGYKLVERLVDEQKVASILFFTGTPHRGKAFGFLALLHLLRPELFNPRQPLAAQLPRLRQVMIRNNKHTVTDLRGQRLFRPPRVVSETYEYSPEEAHFYSMLTEFILTGKAYASQLGAEDQRIVMLVLITMQKLASSSVAAIRRALRGRLQRLEAQKQQLEEAGDLHAQLERHALLENDAAHDELSQLEERIVPLTGGARLMEDEEIRLRELLTAAEAVKRETKIARILSLVEARFAERSVLFFTEYKATQSLLMSELVGRFGDGCVVFINGDERAEDVVGCDGRVRTLRQRREDAAELFNRGKVRFLVSTEAGGEGIDLQESCYSLVHVDLPWNPMRLHQRVGRLNRYGQTQRVEVLTVRNPATVEARIWDKLNEKLESIMRAFGHVMDEPEDLLQMVLGMTSPALFRDVFAEAPGVPAESLGEWFDHKTATFGGQDVIATVKEIVGNCARFDYQAVGHEVPPLDLPDLRPFMESMLVQNHRRPRRESDGSLTFRTPDAWLREVGVQTNYEGLVFDRHVSGKDAVQRVAGVGHKVVDAALREALEQTCCIASVNQSVLRKPIIVARVFDQVTGSEGPLRAVVVGAERAHHEPGWVRLQDWQVVQRLNQALEESAAVRRECVLPADRASVRKAVEAGLNFIASEVPELDLGFRIPSVELCAVLWPGEVRKAAEGITAEPPTDAGTEV